MRYIMAPIVAHLNAGHSGGDSVAIGITVSLFPHLHNPFSPSLISLTVSVDVKHHVYFWHSTVHIYSGEALISGTHVFVAL